jgi:23S rRNA pseudouridine1911/1915/1917 synthase
MMPRLACAKAAVENRTNKIAILCSFTIRDCKLKAGMSERTTYHATLSDAGIRLDQFLVQQIGDVSRSRVQQLIERERVEVNGKVATRAGTKLRGDEEVIVMGTAQPQPLKAKPEKIPLNVVYEDESIAVVDKPAGMMVHAGAASSADDEEDDPRTSGTLVNALLYRFKKLSKEGGDLRPGIVHRLDKDTSGLIIVAKTDSAHRKLAEEFSQRRVKKKYFALVHGCPKQDSGTITASVGRDPVNRNRMSTRTREGRSAVSHYKVVEKLETTYGKFAFIEVTIETGRTHQIRVHLASIGHPVVGDVLYGAAAELAPAAKKPVRAFKAKTKKTLDRHMTEVARSMVEEHAASPQKTKRRAAAGNLSLGRNFLHAAELEFTHPKTEKIVALKSDLPTALRRFLNDLRSATP